MTQALKGDADAGIMKLKAHAVHLKPQYPDAAASLLEGLEELFTINRLGVTGELARCLATTNIIESPNSAVRRLGGQVTRYRDAQMTLRWVAAGFAQVAGARVQTKAKRLARFRLRSTAPCAESRSESP